MSDYKVVPSIGVARVGDAPEKFYIGPEVYRGLPTNPDGSAFGENDFRDADGRLCRQAARFRVFRKTHNGEEEVTLATPGVKSIVWRAHLANKKASWFAFATNEGEDGYASNHPLRNADVENRGSLIIDAGPRQISGANAHGASFDAPSVPPGYRGANFPQGKLNPVERAIESLGELRTDGEGRLLLLGGFGISGTSDEEPVITEYANNDGWWDDTSDGPVTATIELVDGASIVAAPAWAIVAPPAYAPQIPNLVTLWDTVFDAAVRRGCYPEIFSDGLWRRGAAGYRPNFRRDIQQLLERATLYPWVAAIPPKPHKFDMARLGAVPKIGETDANLGLRRWILDVLRAPTDENTIINSRGATAMPYLAGDNCLKPDTLTSSYLRLTETQYFFVQQWAEGWFDDGADNIPAAEAITRGVLENCVGGAFSPGIEMTWISRNGAIYSTTDPYRINAAQETQGPLSFGFTPRAMEPGDVSRYMAVPWQADFNECSSQPIGDRILWWWPAQRPEFVYLSPKPRVLEAAIATPDIETGRQVPWVGTGFDQLRSNFISFADDVEMVQRWSELGFVLGKEVAGETRYFEVARKAPREQTS